MNRAALVLPVALFAASFAIFVGSPNHRMTDSGFSLLVSENLLRHGDLDLARYQLEKDGALNYRLAHVGARVVYYFPLGSAILSVPYVAVGRLVGPPIVNPDGTYAWQVEERDEARLAGLLMALFTVIVFLTARLVLPPGWSLALALCAAFGTPVWSSASRTLWSDSWGLVLVGGAIYLLLRAEARGEAPRPIWLGTLTAWAFFVRPTNGLALAGIAVFLGLCQRRACWTFFVTVGVWMAGLVATSWVCFGAPLPPYFHDRLGRFSGEALAGTLLSPSRGLFTCVPAALAVILLGARFRATGRFVPLVRLATALCVAHWLVLAAFDKWWGGHCFGARLWTGMVPWFALLAVTALDAARRARAQGTVPPGAPFVAGLGLALCALSIAINAAGAISARTVLWNTTPANVDLETDRLWSWRDAQPLAAFCARAPAPDARGPAPGGR